MRSTRWSPGEGKWWRGVSCLAAVLIERGWLDAG